MIRLSYRDIDKEYNLSPEQSSLKEQLLDEISMSSINEAYTEFIRSIDNEVDSIIERYVENKLALSPSGQKVKSIDEQWSKLTPDQQRGPEGDRLSDLGAEADGEILYEKQNIERDIAKVKSAMISQLISWKVD